MHTRNVDAVDLCICIYMLLLLKCTWRGVLLPVAFSQHNNYNFTIAIRYSTFLLYCISLASFYVYFELYALLLCSIRIYFIVKSKLYNKL